MLRYGRRRNQGPTPFTANGLTNCSNLNPGDGVVIFDNLAKRWVLAGHSPAPNYYYCVAISNTDDLTSSSLKWYTYAFSLNSILGTNAQGTTYYPDWPKIGAWPDAYYVGMDMGDPGNGFLDVGTVACAFDRTNMLIGGTARAPQCFVNPSPVTSSPYLAHSLEPADVQGSTPPPVGSPEYFVSIQNPVIDGVTNTSDAINLWQFHVDWTTPANTTFIHTSVPVTPYIPGCYSTSSPGNTECVPESTTASTGQHIDSVGDRLMFRFSYRNFGEYQSYLASHTVQVGTTVRSQTGIRWYEMRGQRSADGISVGHHPAGSDSLSFHAQHCPGSERQCRRGLQRFQRLHASRHERFVVELDGADRAHRNFALQPAPATSRTPTSGVTTAT